MMPPEHTPKLSSAQVRALREIKHGRVIYDGMERRYRSTSWRRDAVRAPSIEKVIALGLAEPTDVARMVALTPAGRQALHDAERKP